MKKSIIIILIIGVIVGTAIISATSSPDMQSSEDGVLSGQVDIGILLPLTGDLTSHGEEDKTAALLAIEDFNLYLQDNNENWYLNGIVEDSQTSPVIALEKLTSLNAKDVNVVVGPASSSNIRNLMGYANSNNMIMISCCSTAPSLAIEGDNVFRMVPDDNNQGPAIAKLMMSDGIQHVIPVWRADAWGDGLKEATVTSFVQAGGTASEGLRYNPESPEFSASTSLLASNVQNSVDEYGSDKVAVLLIAFAESLQFMQSAAEHDILDDVQWFGSDANASEQSIIDDPIGLTFAQTVNFKALQFAANENDITNMVKNHVKSELGRTPSIYAYSSYDAVWIAGLAIEEGQSTNTSDIKENIIPVSRSHTGAVGDTSLNDAGDLASTDYNLWEISDGNWIFSLLRG